MKFEIPFNEEIYKKQMDIYFKLSWENQKKNNRLYNYLGFTLLIIGVLWYLESPKTKIIFPLGLIIIGGLSLISYYKFYISYLKSKRKFNHEVEKISKDYIENPMSQLEFTEDGLVVKDYSGERKLLWTDYFFYKIIGQTLIVIGQNNPIAIDEAEIGHNDFQKVVEIVINSLEKPAANSGLAQ